MAIVAAEDRIAEIVRLGDLILELQIEVRPGGVLTIAPNAQQQGTGNLPSPERNT